jgi:methionyl-tRNA formyltransferase
MEGRMIVVAGQRSWVLRAYEENPIGVCVQDLQAIRSCPQGSKVFFVHWSDIVPEDVIRDYICVGFHMTDLPFGRGGNPLQNLLLRGIYKTKLTAYRMNDKLDEGNILLKKDFEIEDDDWAYDVYEKVSKLALSMIKEIVDKKDYYGVPQDGEAVQFSRLSGEDLKIPLGLTTQEFYDMVRAFDVGHEKGYPKPYIDHGTIRIEFDNTYKDQSGEVVVSGKLCQNWSNKK